MGISRTFLIIVAVVFVTIATFASLGASLLNDSIGGFYHPNAIEGNYGRKYSWVFELLVFLNWLYMMYVVVRSTTETKLKTIGASAVILVLIIAGHNMANLVPRNHHAEYFIGKEKYSIPWQYNPINGSSKPNGEYFVIHASYPDFTGQYAAKDYYKQQLTLSKSVFHEERRVGSSIDDTICHEGVCGGLSPSSNMHFVEGDFIYQIHYQGEAVIFRSKSELDEFKEAIIELFDSFKAK
jgi:hypothetical protein